MSRRTITRAREPDPAFSVLRYPDPREYYYELWYIILKEEARKMGTNLSSEVLKRVAHMLTDAYFIHYDPVPGLRDPTVIEDPATRAVAGVFSQYMSSEKYRRVHSETKLKQHVSLFFAKELAKTIIEEISRMPEFQELIQRSEEIRRQVVERARRYAEERMRSNGQQRQMGSRRGVTRRQSNVQQSRVGTGQEPAKQTRPSTQSTLSSQSSGAQVQQLQQSQSAQAQQSQGTREAQASARPEQRQGAQSGLSNQMQQVLQQLERQVGNIEPATPATPQLLQQIMQSIMQAVQQQSSTPSQSQTTQGNTQGSQSSEARSSDASQGSQNAQSQSQSRNRFGSMMEELREMEGKKCDSGSSENNGIGLPSDAVSGGKPSSVQDNWMPKPTGPGSPSTQSGEVGRPSGSSSSSMQGDALPLGGASTPQSASAGQTTTPMQPTLASEASYEAGEEQGIGGVEQTSGVEAAEASGGAQMWSGVGSGEFGEVDEESLRELARELAEKSRRSGKRGRSGEVVEAEVEEGESGDASTTKPRRAGMPGKPDLDAASAEVAEAEQGYGASGGIFDNVGGEANAEAATASATASATGAESLEGRGGIGGAIADALKSLVQGEEFGGKVRGVDVEDLFAEGEGLGKDVDVDEVEPSEEDVKKAIREVSSSAKDVEMRISWTVEAAVSRALEQAANRVMVAVESGAGKIVEKGFEHKKGVSSRGIGKSPLVMAEYIERLVDMSDVLQILKEGLKMAKKWIDKKFEWGLFGEVRGVTKARRLEDVLPTQLGEPDELFEVRLAENNFLALEREYPRMRDVLFVLDFSGSMSDYSYGKPKHYWVKAAVAAVWYASDLDEVKIRAILFNYGIVGDVELNDIDALINFLRMLPGGGTEFEDTLRYAAAVAQKMNRPNVVFITDGIAPLSQSAAVEVAQMLKKADAVFSAFFVEEGAGSSDVFQNAKLIAKATGGRAMTIDDIVAAGKQAVESAMKQ